MKNLFLAILFFPALLRAATLSQFYSGLEITSGDLVSQVGESSSVAPFTGPTNNLAVFLRADDGVTTTNATGGLFSAATEYVTAWRDVHNQYNDDGITNIFAQTNFNKMPSYLTDAFGNRCLDFPWGFSTTHSTNVLSCSTVTNLSAQNMTIYVVGQCEDTVSDQRLINFPSWGFALMGIPKLQFTQFRISTLYTPLNKSVWVSGQSASRCVFRVNDVQQELSAIADQALNGMDIGSVTAPFAGRIFAVLVYRTAHTDSEITNTVAALSTLFNVRTNYTTEVLAVGDSITAGLGATNNYSWPFQLMERMTNVLFYNYGIGGIVMGTNGDAAGASMYGNGNLSALRNTNRVGWVAQKAGVNDLNTVAGLTGAGAYGRATNLAALYLTAWDDVMVATIANESAGAGGGNLTNSTLLDFNNQLRTNTPSFTWYLSDSGAGSPVETRLLNPSDTTYFYDGLHLVNAGYRVVADHYYTNLLLNLP